MLAAVLLTWLLHSIVAMSWADHSVVHSAADQQDSTVDQQDPQHLWHKESNAERGI